MSISFRILRATALVTMLALPIVLACSSSDSTDPDTPNTALTPEHAVRQSGPFDEVLADSASFAQMRFDSTGTDLRCTEYEIRQTRVVDRLTTLAPDPDRHHAGAVLQGAHRALLVPPIVDAARSGGTLTLMLADSSEHAGTVDAMDAGSVAAWRQSMLTDLGPAAPGEWAIDVRTVRGTQEIALGARVDAGAVPGEVNQRLAFGTGEFGRALVRLQRTHHTITAPRPPGTGGTAFAPGVTYEETFAQMGYGNPPAWVAGVDHGQLLLVLVEAEAAEDQVIAAAANSFAAAAANTAPDAGQPLVHDLPGVVFKAFGLGADADDAESAAAGGQAALTAFLQDAPADPAALPAVTAELVALLDGAPVSMAAAGEFNATVCEVYTPVFDEVFWSFEAGDAHTERLPGDLQTNREGRFYYVGGTTQFINDHVERIPDLVGQGGFALPQGRRAVRLPDMIGGRPALELFELTLPDGVIHSALSFDGSQIVGEDYTIFLVVGLPRKIRLTYATAIGDQSVSGLNMANYILHGTGDGVRHNMYFGWPNREETVFSHVPYLVQPVHHPVQDWHVYTVRFGINEGLSIFHNGELIDQDTTDNYPLFEFSGATLCARWYGVDGFALAVLWLGEVTAYAGAGSDQQVADETVRLREKYGF
jgi:hypothetical protein